MSENSTTQSHAPRVEIALHTAADHNLLVRTLDADGLESERLNRDYSADHEADLLIIDPPSLQRLRGHIVRLRDKASPAVLPVLLLAQNAQISQEVIRRELGHTVEDVLRLPSTGLEIRARVRNLLRLRQLSLRQLREHDLTRQSLDGVARALRTLHACNELMLRETTEDGLVSAVCHIIAQSKEYALAWAGFAEHNAQTGSNIIIRAAAGPAANYTDDLEVRWNDCAKGRGPVGRALATGETQRVADLTIDPSVEPWQAQIEAWGLRAMIALPLRPQHGTAGVLVVGSLQPGDFKAEERQLLERLATNLAFGIDKLRIKRERERQETEIRQLAYSDALTSLPNRRALLHHLEQVVANDEDQAVAVLFIDLNDFKLVNDALGHAAGDEVLKRAARRIQRTLRQGDLVARQGGDEFIAVLVDDPHSPAVAAEEGIQRLTRGAEALAGRIIEILQRPFDIEGYRHRVGASIGISLLPYLSADAATVIDQADMAMYQAKQTGKQLAFYAPDIGQDRQQRLSIEAQLHYALEAEEFYLHYQPIWEIDGGRIVGVEALLRWTNAAGRVVPPGEFIPVAEEIGLIGPLGDWVLVTAARQLASWRRDGIDIYMAVNLSVSQLQGVEASQHIHDLVIGEDTKPGWWLLELTEDMLMRAPEEVAEAMHALSNAGFRLALDDFGRGYSSLARLQLMPLEVLKIDKLFVDRLCKDASGGGVVRAIIDLGRNLSMRVVAEGIEADEQRDRLAALGCRWGQGFLISAARPPGEIPALIKQCEQTQGLRA